MCSITTNPSISASTALVTLSGITVRVMKALLTAGYDIHASHADCLPRLQNDETVSHPVIAWDTGKA